MEYEQCPGANLEPLPKLAQTTPDYDPTLVDWRSIKKAVEYLAAKEPRFCNFAIRTPVPPLLAFHSILHTCYAFCHGT